MLRFWEGLIDTGLFSDKSGRSGTRSWPGVMLGGGIGLRLMGFPVSMIPTSLFVPLNVGLSANGLLYSLGSGGVKKDRVGGEYDGIFPECIGNVGYFLLCPENLNFLVVVIKSIK